MNDGIVLLWLVRLRWLAATGQLVTIVAAALGLGIAYTWVPLVGVIAITLATNAMLTWRPVAAWMKRRGTAAAAGVVVLDIVLLTVMLYVTGGSDNPFAILYVLHVALAASVLGNWWTWAIVGVVAACYGAIAYEHWPLDPDGNITSGTLAFGRAAALLLVVALIAYFVTRVVGALAARDKELAATREQAQVSERLAALTTLAAGAAHELGTPLATIAVVAKEMELAATKLEAPDVAEDASLVRQQVDRCRDILERLRGDVAGRTTDERGTARPDEAAETIRKRLAPDRRHRLDLKLQATLPPIAAADRAVHQALDLLVNNAFDAIDAASELPADRRRVSLDVTRGKKFVTFTVVDRGPGMDDATLRRAIEPFYTTKDPGRGMGLGLFLVRLVAEHNGGRFDLDSAPGVGTTATLDLPLA